MHVELDAGHAHVARELEGGHRILGSGGGQAPVGEKQRPGDLGEESEPAQRSSPSDARRLSASSSESAFASESNLANSASSDRSPRSSPVIIWSSARSLSGSTLRSRALIAGSCAVIRATLERRSASSLSRKASLPPASSTLERAAWTRAAIA